MSSKRLVNYLVIASIVPLMVQMILFYMNSAGSSKNLELGSATLGFAAVCFNVGFFAVACRKRREDLAGFSMMVLLAAVASVPVWYAPLAALVLLALIVFGIRQIMHEPNHRPFEFAPVPLVLAIMACAWSIRLDTEGWRLVSYMLDAAGVAFAWIATTAFLNRDGFGQRGPMKLAPRPATTGASPLYHLDADDHKSKPPFPDFPDRLQG
ncbi:MAG: hypothetical protein AB199_03840 [Parcubacteria bacterium C7867-004]|nr:MAG: hypothetical protein AB199_03840 [Parcubacteria bacterium C7867-004]